MIDVDGLFQVCDKDVRGAKTPYQPYDSWHIHRHRSRSFSDLIEPGMQNAIDEQFQKIGTNRIQVTPGGGSFGGPEASGLLQKNFQTMM